MNRLNGNDMESWIENGMGSVEVANELKISVPEVMELINKSFAAPAVRKYKRQLAKNTKKNKEKKENTVLKVKNTEAPKPTLAELLEKEKAQQEVTAQQEVIVKKTIQEYRKVLEEVSSKTKQVSDLIAKLIAMKEEIGNMEEKAITVLVNHDVELKKLHDEQETLRGIREEIEKRRIVNVFLYADGSISIECNGNDIETDFAGWKEKKDELEERYYEILSDLQLKYVRQLAKLMCLPKLTDQHYEIGFELAEIQDVYNKITSANEEE